MKRIIKYKTILIILFSVILNVFSFNKASAQQYTEYEVKSAYIYNFIKFIEWPSKCFENEYSPFVIGIYGEDPFGEIINIAFEDRTLYNRKWILKHVKTEEEIKSCHLLIIAGINKPEMLKALNIAGKYPILTVGDNLENFCESGGIINFTSQNSKFRFEINNSTAIRLNLSISSKLLSLAKIIKQDEDRF